jgi:hypothetical protein
MRATTSSRIAAVGRTIAPQAAGRSTPACVAASPTATEAASTGIVQSIGPPRIPSPRTEGLLRGLLPSLVMTRNNPEPHPFGATRASRVHPADRSSRRSAPRSTTKARRLRLCPSTAAAVRSDKLRDAEVGSSNLPHPTPAQAALRCRLKRVHGPSIARPSRGDARRNRRPMALAAASPCSVTTWA